MIRSLSSLGLVAALLAVPSATASGPPESPTLSPIGESVAYLTFAYHISAADAARRIRLQADKDALTQRLARALPGEYAGGWLDQEHGGVLAVASTRPDHTRQVVRTMPHGAEIRVVPAAYSLAELTRIRRRAAGRTGAYAQVDVVRDRVDVWTNRPTRVAAARSPLGPERHAVTVRTPPRETPTACTWNSCDPPIRAGILIQIGDAEGQPLDFCTSGFNIQDNHGNLYTSTAGHCFTDKRGAETIVSVKEHNGVSLVGDERSNGSFIQNAPFPRLDFAFIRVTDTATWFPNGKPWNIDYFHCSKEPQPRPCNTSLQKHRYRITGIKQYGNMSEGEVVCMSGASIQTRRVEPGTRCGEITGLPNGGIRTNICAKPGDSGSPLFDQNTGVAYGIENFVAGDTVVGSKCLPFDQQKTHYTALSSALAAADNSPHRTYSLITS